MRDGGFMPGLLCCDCLDQVINKYINFAKILSKVNFLGIFGILEKKK